MENLFHFLCKLYITKSFWPIGLRRCNQNWRVPDSNPTRCLAGLRDPTLLQGSWWLSGWICKMQWLTSCEWDCLLDTGPKLTVVQPNSSFANFIPNIYKQDLNLPEGERHWWLVGWELKFSWLIRIAMVAVTLNLLAIKVSIVLEINISSSSSTDWQRRRHQWIKVTFHIKISWLATLQFKESRKKKRELKKKDWKKMVSRWKDRWKL